jgi:hypothetical protein
MRTIHKLNLLAVAAAMKAIVPVVITMARVVLVISLRSAMSAKDTFEKSIRLANPFRPT